jgi:hypothetical protein
VRFIRTGRPAFASALAALVVVMLAGSASAQAAITPSRDAGAVAAAITDPLGPAAFVGASFSTLPPEPGSDPECSDGEDNDGDGLTDSSDPGCDSGPGDNREEDDPLPQCGNGFDDDGDGLVDFAPPGGETADPGCSSAADDQEIEGEPEPTPQCANGADDDGDGRIDFTPPAGQSADPGCASAGDLDEGSEGLPPGADTNPAAVSDSSLAGFPASGTTYAILSSGNTLFADDANDSGSASQTNGNGAGTEIHGDSVLDLVTLKVDLSVPLSANCLRLDFRFLSEEFPEFVGSAFNDGFLAELDASSFIVDATNPTNPISAPNNFAFDSGGRVVSVNTAGFSEANAAGTTYDGATPKLHASTPITPGAHSIYLSVFDQGDSAYDSAAFIDALTLVNAPAGACATGATADETPPAVSLAAPAAGSSSADTTPTFSGSAGTAPGDSNTVTAKVYAGSSAAGTPVQTLTATRSGGSWSAAAASPLAPGTYTVRAEQSDSAGNLGVSAPRTFTIVASTSGPGGSAGGAKPTPEEPESMPKLGKRVVAKVVNGVILVRRPGSRSFVKLAAAASVPIGSIVDARRGSVRITAAADRKGRVYSAVFSGGIFKVLQRGRVNSVTELRLVGKLERCGKPGRASAAKVKGRRLWGRGKGRFRTRGRRSAATVTGTHWLVADRCDGSTLTRVREGTVSVRDFGRRVTLQLRRGQRYVAR